jgi:glycopeptide antibiotics resistance protein
LIRWRKKHHWRDLICWALFGVYLLGVINLTLFPLPIWVDWELRTPVLAILSQINLIPFRFGDLFDFPPIYAIHELGGNVLLTLPFGILIPLLISINARQLPRLAILVGFSTELAQLVMCLVVGGYYRSVNINDVLLNGIGVLVGFASLRAVTLIAQRITYVLGRGRTA